MPALFSLGLDSPLRSFAAELRPDERGLAFLDDMYVTAQPARTCELHARLAHMLESSVGIRLHVGNFFFPGPFHVWNAGGIEPAGVRELGPHAWLGDPARPANERGLRVLGLPVGTPQFVTRELASLIFPPAEPAAVV